MMRFLFSCSKVEKMNHLKLNREHNLCRSYCRRREWKSVTTKITVIIPGNDWHYKDSLTSKQWDSGVSMEIGQPFRRSQTLAPKQHVCACARIIEFSRLPHGANVNVFPLLKTTKTHVVAHRWILTLHSVWTTWVTYSEHPAWLFSLTALCLFGGGCSNIVLSPHTHTHKVRCERQTPIFISIREP